MTCGFGFVFKFGAGSGSSMLLSYPNLGIYSIPFFFFLSKSETKVINAIMYIFCKPKLNHLELKQNQTKRN